MFPILCDLAHVAGWDLFSVQNLLIAHVSWLGSVLNRPCSALYADPVQPFTTAGNELDHL